MARRGHFPPSAWQQLSLHGIDYAPPKVRQHGLQEAPLRPLVSNGKREDGTFAGSFVAPAPRAWEDFGSIELRTPNSYPALILDIDGRDRLMAYLEAVLAGRLKRYNWLVARDGKEGASGGHAVYTLARPVLRGAQARAAPLRTLARASEYYGAVAGADVGYRAVLTHNPMSRAHRGNAGNLQTRWDRKEPYTLAELGEVIPGGWRVPKIPQTAYGRNCAVFEALMRFAGSPENRDAALLPHARLVNRDVWAGLFPDRGALSENELQGIVRSVERYRARWIAQDRYQQADWIERQAARGRKSGEKRRKRNRDRDKAIHAFAAEGRTQRQIAAMVGVDQATVSRVLRAADRPNMHEPHS